MRRVNHLVLAVFLGALVAVVSAWFFPSAALSRASAQVAAPELEPNDGWLNTDRPISIEDDLAGHVVVLDFWTFCCINCMHVLPDLEYLEEKYADEPVVVIGVHSAKFEAEGEPDAINEAIRRYDIKHPVVVDKDMRIWRKYQARAWPTFVVIDTEGVVYGSTAGEGKRELLDQAIQTLLDKGRVNGTLAEEKFELAPAATPVTGSPLSYPGKVLAVGPTGDEPGRLFIADSSNDRVVIASWPDESGVTRVQRVVGSGERGFEDGAASAASFHDPQGFAYDHGSGTLYVADTKNHAIRAIDAATGAVSTIAGTGEQSYDREGGKRGTNQGLSSPWALALDEGSQTLYIAMAGTHQLWSMDLGSTKINAIAGSGRENIYDGPAMKAALAQPSGLALGADNRTLYFADSEGSAIRALDLDRMEVRTIIGRSVSNTLTDTSLFEFGDVDGRAPDALMQHPLGVTLFPSGGRELLLVADTYNDKIKLVHPDTMGSTTWAGGAKPGEAGEGELVLDEPAGLSLAVGPGAEQVLFVADTNAHRIVRIDPATGAHTVITFEGLE